MALCNISERHVIDLNIQYESQQVAKIKSWTVIFSFGKPMVEKKQIMSPVSRNGVYVYALDQAPLNDYLTEVFKRTKDIASAEDQNKVLGGITSLQV